MSRFSTLFRHGFHRIDGMIFSKRRFSVAAVISSLGRQGAFRYRRARGNWIAATAAAIGVAGVVIARNTISAATADNADYAPSTSRRAQFNFIADLVEEVSGSVVYINVTSRHSSFGVVQSNGTGFVVKEDGLILTNAHIVASQPGAKIEVRLADGSTMIGTIEYVDRHLDLAAVRVNKKSLPVLKFGDSSKARPGEWVIAVGHPLSLANTVTMGVISTTNRRSTELNLGRNVEYIQTDAAINQGNSGGPLVNLDGEVVGINCMSVSGASGISFALPSNYAKNFLENLGKVPTPKSLPRRRTLGVNLLQLDERIVNEFRQWLPDFPDVEAGGFVHSIMLGSAAHESGIQPGDVITHVNDKQVTSVSDIYKALDSQNDIVLTVRRSRKVMKINVSFKD